MGIVGSGSPLDGQVEELCTQLGALAVTAGFRIATGGLGGVMEAVARGAHQARERVEGDVVGVLPSYDAASANPWVDIAVPTGMGLARNVVLVAMSDVVVAVDGGSGTLSEMSLAWQMRKPIIALANAGGWSAKLADTAIDERRNDKIVSASSAQEAVTVALQLTAVARR